jgi:hypothetical protein
MLTESEIRNERFIVSSENLPYKKIIELVCASLGKPLPNKKAGNLILEFVWRLDAILSKLRGCRNLLTKEIAKYATMNLSYSNKKIKDSIRIDFIPISKSVLETANHFLADKK